MRPLRAISSMVLSLNYSVQGLPAGFSISSFGVAGFFGPGDIANSPYHVTITATDGFYSTSTTFDWTVAPASPISVQSPSRITSHVNAVIHQQVQATTTAGLPLTYSATGLPTGLSINAQTGLITGTLAMLSAIPGTFNPLITVTDGVNTSSTQFEWTIKTADSPNFVNLPIPGGGLLELASPSNTQLSASISPTAGVGVPNGIQFPFGYLNFQIISLSPQALAPGGVVALELVINGQSTTGINQYFKYGPTPANPAPHWYDFLLNQTTDSDIATGTGMSSLGGGIYTLRLVDGGRGDDDLSANGIIEDLGGLGTGTITITSANTTTTLTSDHVTGSTYGQDVHFTATVSSASGTPTGSVQFKIDGQNVGSPQTLVGGVASLDVPKLSAVDHAIVALYSSDNGNFIGSAGDFTQDVNPALLTITAANKTKSYGAAAPCAGDRLLGIHHG